MSFYVFEMFGKVGSQIHLLAVPRLGEFSGVTSQDKVTSVACACKKLIPHNFVQKLKFCYDEADRTMYCLAAADEVAETYCAYSLRVGEVNVSFFKVSSVVMRENLVRAYLDVDITVKVPFFSALFKFSIVLVLFLCFFACILRIQILQANFLCAY